jgi:predicted amidohydrolase YtcJ
MSRKRYPDVFENPENQMRALRDAGRLMQRAGVIMATDHFFGGPSKGAEAAMHGMYALATSQADFPVRVQLVYDGAGLVQNWGDEAVTHLQEVKQRDTDKLRTGMVKFTLDGSVQGYTAQIAPGYWNGAGNPIWNVTEEQFLEYGERFWNAHFPLKVHVNGELSVEALLNGLDVLQKRSPWPDHRTTFEHCPAVTREQYTRIANAGATVNLFTNHIDYWGEQHYTITLGPGRADAIASAATAKSLKIPYSFHSDAPITPSSPLFAIWAAVNRTTRTGGVLGNDQRISALDALRAVTSGAAYLLRIEKENGSIEPGKRADLTVLADNPLTVPAPAIRNIPVRATVLGGQVFMVPPVGGGQ